MPFRLRGMCSMSRFAGSSNWTSMSLLTLNTVFSERAPAAVLHPAGSTRGPSRRRCCCASAFLCCVSGRTNAKSRGVDAWATPAQCLVK